jgi:hypothetical protein
MSVLALIRNLHSDLKLCVPCIEHFLLRSILLRIYLLLTFFDYLSLLDLSDEQRSLVLVASKGLYGLLIRALMELPVKKILVDVE